MSEGLKSLRIEGLIGNGCFGYVFLARSTEFRSLAWKRMLKAGDKVSREFEILERVKGAKRVVNLIHFFYSINCVNEVIQNFVFDFYSSNLEEVLKLHQNKIISMSYSTIKKVMFQVLQGISELHSRQVCHRDLKPENVLIKDSTCVIADLGSAKVLQEKNSPYVVSRYYRAPELILGIDSYNQSIDLWSFGVIFFEFLAKKLPFKGRTEGQQLIEIFRALGAPSEEDSSWLKGRMRRVPLEAEVIFSIRDNKNVLKCLEHLKISETELKMLKELFQSIWKYRFSQRPKASEVVDLPFWDDVRNSAESFRIAI